MTQVKKSKTRKQNLMKKCDNKRSTLVKRRAGWKCEVDGCTNDKYLNAHHVFTRNNRSTRYDLDNWIALCPSHHTFSNTFSAHRTPMEFAERIIKKRWKKRYDDLKLKANKIWDKDYDKVVEYLDNKEKEINESKNS